MQDKSKFDNIRPYTDEEAKSAFSRISQWKYFNDIFDYVAPDKPIEEIKRMISGIESVEEFQSKVMSIVIRSIVSKTTDGISHSGIDNLKDGKKHLLLSNHRDIILDPAIIQLIFHENLVPKTEIAVGDNLITSSAIEDVTRSNGMVKVIREGSPREKYSNSTLLSEYIREKVSTQLCSMWIAQRNGRAKDGIDHTEQGLLKMLEMSGNGDFVRDFDELSIIPVSISYQYEPCDFLKARELYISKREKYIKKPGEDLVSILTGVKQNKGKVHFHFDSHISREEIETCSKYDKNDRFKSLASLIDEKIISSYRLWNNNYIAYDMLHGTSEFERMYSKEEKEAFSDYVNIGLAKIVAQEPFMELVELKEIFLSIYSNPITV